MRLIWVIDTWGVEGRWGLEGVFFTGLWRSGLIWGIGTELPGLLRRSPALIDRVLMIAQIKGLAIVQSSFREILYLDSGTSLLLS